MLRSKLRFLNLFALACLAAGAASSDVIIPSTAYIIPGNGAEFRTDVRAFNPGAVPVTVTPVFYNQATPETLTASTVTIGPREQQAWDNILATLFGKGPADGAFGPIRFQTTGTLLVSSATNNYNGCGNGAVSGQWIPGIDVGQGLNKGTLLQLAANPDLSTGYRTNIVFVNPGSQTATVNTAVRKGDATQLATFQYVLPANGFKQVNNWRDFPGVRDNPDTDLYLEFTSDQPVLSYASVINNLSGDPFAIVMTAEPTVPTAAPVASYTVSASPKANQPVTFTDTSTNSPTQQLWAFGDGATATSGVTATHTYAAAGTYKSTHFVSNAGGASGAIQDVVVTAASTGPVAFQVSAHQYTYDVPAAYKGSEPGEMILHVGTTYTLTFKNTDADPTVRHGANGLAFTYLAPGKKCDPIPSSGCVITITPTPANLSFPGPSYPFNCTVTDCGSGHDGMTGLITIVP